MFSLNEEELFSLSNEVKSLQSQLESIQSFATKIRERSKATNPIQTEDRNAFEENLDLILAIQNTPSFKETVIQYFLNHLFEPNISFRDIIDYALCSPNSLCSKHQREVKLSAALITQVVIKNHPTFPYSVAQIIVSYIVIDHEIKQCKSSLRVNDEVQSLFSKMRQNKEFSSGLYDMFVRVDRRLFVPEHEKDECNSYDRPISLNYGVSLSAPHIHVHALKQFEHLLNVQNDGESAIKFLDVGCGTGYVCTLMAVGFVLNNTNESYFKSYGCIYNESLLQQAIEARDKLNLTSFLDYKHSSIDMMDIGWTDNAPFDGIYCGAAIKEKDSILLREQLTVGGYLMCVVEHPDSAAKQVMKLIKRIKKSDYYHMEKMQKVQKVTETAEDKEEEEEEEEEEDIKECEEEEEEEEEVEQREEEEEETKEDPTKAAPTRTLNAYFREQQMEQPALASASASASADLNGIEKGDIINLILKLQNAMIYLRSDEENESDDHEEEKKEELSGSDHEDEEEELLMRKQKIGSNDSDFEETELFDVRFRTLRGRFPYLKNGLMSDSDSDDDSD